MRERDIPTQAPFVRLVYNDHTVHNPDCDILEGHLDNDRSITYGTYVSGPDKGKEFMEYYRGHNYMVGSQVRSHSRFWHDPVNIPVKYFTRWQKLRQIYQQLKNC